MRSALSSPEARELVSNPVRKRECVPSLKQRWLILFSALVILGFQIGLFQAIQRFQLRKPDFAALYQAGRKLDHERFPSLLDRLPALDTKEYSVQLDGRDWDADT